MGQKTGAITLIVLGAALLLGAVSFWVDSMSLPEPPGLGQTLRDWITTLAGLGASIAGWQGLLKKEKPAPPAPPSQSTSGDRSPIHAGTGDIVQVESGAEYVKGDKHVHLAPEPEKPHDTIGFIPPFSMDTYIHRGQIEEELLAFLQKGGQGAIVGLHAPGGLGKTELAKRAAQTLQAQSHYETLWVDVGEKSARRRWPICF